MFLIHVPGDGCTTATILTVRVRSDEPRSHTVDITFTLKNDYPLCVPDISLSCPSLSRTDTGLLKADVERYADTLIGQPMLLMLTLYVKERLENVKVDSTEAQVTDHGRSRRRIVLLHLDHMRAKVRYTKTVGQWAEELALTGRLICHERLILILLEGTQDALKVSRNHMCIARGLVSGDRCMSGSTSDDTIKYMYASCTLLMATR